MAANCGRKNVSYSNFETIYYYYCHKHGSYWNSWLGFCIRNKNWAIFDPYKTMYKMSAPENGKKNKINNSIMQLLIALNIHLVVANIWLPFLPNDLGHNIFAVTLSTLIEHIVMALIMMPTLKCRGYRTFPGIFSHICLWKITKCSK